MKIDYKKTTKNNNKMEQRENMINTIIKSVSITIIKSVSITNQNSNQQGEESKLLSFFYVIDE